MTATRHEPVAELERANAALQRQLDECRTERDAAMAREAALAEVLDTINSSPGDPLPVFEVILDKAHNLCGAAVGSLMTFDGEHFRAVATRGFPERHAATVRRPFRPNSHHRLLMGGERLVHIPDVKALEIGPDDAVERSTIDRTDVRTLLAVPLRKDDVFFGYISAFRHEVRPFSKNEITLLESFAAQAVIAMENARLLTEQREALEQQTATADVLQIINGSPGDLAPVFDTMLEKAIRLCESSFGTFVLYDGQAFNHVAMRGVPPTLAEFFRAPISPSPGMTLYRVVHGEAVVHVADLTDDEVYRSGNPARKALADLGGARTQLLVALRKDDTLLGVFNIFRQEVRLFSDKQIALLQSFAAQAVIAMENARLLDALRQRTGDLEESLQYQTATSDVLKVISRSTFDLQPVLDTLVQTAARLCEADTAGISTRDSDRYRVVAVWSGTPEFGTFIRGRSFAPNRTSVTGRTVLEGQVVHVADLTADPEYTVTEAVTLGGVRTLLGVPLLREGQVVGVINLARVRVQPFSDRQIELVRTFADQAVIAIENVRLLTEQRQALEQQMATAEVLQVINASPGNLMPVFQAIVEKAHILCDAAYGSLQLWDGDKFRGVAMRGFSEPMVERLRLGYSPWPNMPCRRLVEGERVAHCADLAEIDDPTARVGVTLGGVRTVLYVALRKEDVLLGQIVAARQEVRPFTEKQIALVESFAAQAVIAMENARLITEQREALQQQTATAEVLQVINASPGDLAPVFDAMLEKAMRLCEAAFGALFVPDVDVVRLVRSRNVPPEFKAYLEREPPRLDAGSLLSRAMREQTVLNVADLRETPPFRDGVSLSVAAVELAGIRSICWVPLIHETTALGLFAIFRQEVRPFSDKQVALLRNFAAQAVIAMENARLITEQREALEQQTATAEVLEVINTSPGNLAPVFDSVLEKAMRLCGAAFGSFYIYDGEHFHSAAQRGVPAAYAEFRAHNPPRPLPGGTFARALETRRTLQVIDLKADTLYLDGNPGTRAMVELGGVRTHLTVPLCKDEAVLGLITVFRQEVRAFSETQIALLESFAAQAVIAMENARLITEQREALEQQTATAGVLQVINASPGDLMPVFDAMLEKAMLLCEVIFGVLYTYDGNRFHVAATRGVPAALAEFRTKHPPSGHVGGSAAPLFETLRPVHVLDMKAEEFYLTGDVINRATVDLGGARTTLTVPLLKEGVLLGGITVYRQEVRAFSDKQIVLLENFAAQAVIAMENARLLHELRARTDELAQRQAELRVTFENMGDGVAMFDETNNLVAWNRKFQEIFNVPDALLEEHRTFADYIRFLAERGDYGPDVDPEDQVRRLAENASQQHAYERMRPDGKVIEIRHNPVAGGGFVMIFSDITERKRNEAEIQAARDAAEAAYRELKATQANLIQAEKMASLGQLTAGIAHEIKNPLNFVNNFSILSVELLDELKQAVDPVLPALDEDRQAEVGEIVGMLTSNLEKITEHGQRVDGIVRSMLEHSRGGSGDRRSIDLNTLVEEALNLAYHGARAQDRSFNITLRRDLAEAIPPIDLVPQDVTRVLLNLFSNGFYAAHKRQMSETVSSFEPTLEVATRDLGDAVEIRVRDNGTGIPAEIRDKLFQPFFTTKPTGEGTGLGLSISYDIVTQQHGGAITVDSTVGEYSEFTIRLPRAP